MFPKDDERDWSFNMAFKSVVHSLGNDIRRGTLGTHGNERFAFEVRTREPHFCFVSQDISKAELLYNKSHLSDLATGEATPTATATAATPAILKGSVSITSGTAELPSSFLSDERAVCWDLDPRMNHSGSMDAPPRSVMKARVMPPPRPLPVRRASVKSVSWADEEEEEEEEEEEVSEELCD